MGLGQNLSSRKKRLCKEVKIHKVYDKQYLFMPNMLYIEHDN